MSSGLELRSIGSLLSKHFSGAWGSDPGRGSSNATVLRSTDIDDDGHVDLAKGAQRQLSPRDLSAKRLRAGDILLEASGGGPGKPVGRPAWFADETPEGHYATSNFFKVLRADPDLVDAKYLLYALVLLVKRPEIWRFQQQTTGITNLKFSEYLKHLIVTPPLPDQRRIANVLDSLDDQILSTSDVIAKLRLAWNGYLDETLPSAPGNSRFSGWTWRSLREITEIGSGSTPNRSSSSYWKRGTVPWVKTSEVASGSVRSTDEQITVAAVSDLGLRRYPKGTILMAMYGEGATRGRVASLEIDACINQACAAIISTRGVVQPRYLLHVLRARYKELRALSQGSNQANLSAGIIGGFPIPLPTTIRDQDRIADGLDAFEAIVEMEIRRRNTLVLLKDGLMADLLSGRVRVPEGMAF
jgi:type I restriction enzyme S subunit